jgi:tRNA-splicing ligase RtcB
MSASTLNGRNVPIKLWAPLHEVDSRVIGQLKNVAALPWVAHHVAVMADVHAGRGATVGSVIAMRGAVAPAAVGVDIGCGMAAVETSLRARDLPDDLGQLRGEIEAAIPVGKHAHDEPVWRGLSAETRREGSALMERFSELDANVAGLAGPASRQIGTLGGGNHFVEICLDTAGGVWVMLHSGSRRMGAALAEQHIEIAQRLNHNQALQDRDLAVFLAGTRAFESYRRDLYWAQDYARFNREVMLALLARVLRRRWPAISFREAISCHHNYVAEERHFGEDLLVTRKGAIRARAGDLGIIPGSMGTKSFIVRGKGSADSFESASHGAGRRMSRTEARKRFSARDLRDQTEGVECRKDSGVIDEAPKAYKNIDQVMAAQTDLVEIVAELKQVLCVKG